MANRIYETAIKLTAQLAGNFRGTMAGATGAVEKLAARQKKLQDIAGKVGNLNKLTTALGEAKAHHSALSTASLKLAKAQLESGERTAEDAEQLKRLQARAAAAAKDVNRLTQAATKAGVALKAAGVDTHDLEGKQKDLARQLEKTERKLKGAAWMRSGAGKIKAGLGGAAGNVRDLAGDAAKVGAAGVAAGFGLFELVKRAARSPNH
jgi:chromosome segregation ATPase